MTSASRSAAPPAPPALPPALAALRRFNRLVAPAAPRVAAAVNAHLFVRPRRLPARRWEPAVEAAARRVALGAGRSALAWGDDGPLVLAMHGWEGRATQFGVLAGTLVAAGFRVVAPDGPGHGRSTGRIAHPPAFADALRDAQTALASAFGAPHAVIGHSMGAAAALLAVTDGLPTQRVVLVAGPASLRDVLRRFTDAVGLDDRAHRHFARTVERVARRSADDGDLETFAARLDRPLLVLHDTDDPDVPFDDARRLARAAPGARLVALEDAGHHRILRDPRAATEILAFLGAAGDQSVAAR